MVLVAIIAFVADLTGLYSFFTQKDIREEVQPVLQGQEKIKRSQEDTNKLLLDHLKINRDDLKKKYPLGYALFYIDSKEIFAPNEVSESIDVDWGKSKVLSYSDTTVSILFPSITITHKKKKFSLHSDNSYTSLQRASINKPERIYGINDILLIATILINEKDYIIGVVGIEQLNEDQLREIRQRRLEIQTFFERSRPTTP